MKKARKKGPVTAKKILYDGILFASGLEKYMYKALKEAGIDFKYEGVTFELVPSFIFENVSKCFSMFLSKSTRHVCFIVVDQCAILQ